MKTICLFWDFDETLAFRDGKWTQSVCNILQRSGYEGYDALAISAAMQPHYPWAKHEMPHEEYFNGLSWWEYIRQFVVEAGLDVAGIKSVQEKRVLSAQFKDEYLRTDAWHLYEDTERNLIRAAKEGCDNVILSNHTPELEMLAENLGIKKYFRDIITSANVGYEKPNPLFYKVTESFTGYQDYYMTGNSYSADVKGALDYGISAVLVRGDNEHNYPAFSKTLDGIWKYIK